MKLVRRARTTRFARDHEFERIRGVADYQKRVPLRAYEDFWTQYWRSDFPCLTNVTWPGTIPYLALSSGTTGGPTKHIPVSTQMLRSNRRAALTALAFYGAANPESRLFEGRLFFLGGSTDLTRLTPRHSIPPFCRAPRQILAGDLSAIASREVGRAFHPYTFPPAELALIRDWDEKIQLLAERSASLPITAICGIPSWLLVLFGRLKQLTGRRSIAEIWPTLRLVIHGGTKFDPYQDLFRQEIGSDRVQFLETYPCSEGFVAAEDPAYERLRLIPDHGIFFEFVPVEDLGKDHPVRHTTANLETGVQYAVVLTTCAGLWSYVLGDTVCFQAREPPLLRFTGRTRYFLSAFGEHLISEEVEKAITKASEATGAAVTDFHVGPQFPTSTAVAGRHLYLIEFARMPVGIPTFAKELDAALCRLNDDYRGHRQGDLSLAGPEIRLVPPGGFARWLRSKGRLGGQHKVPRMDNSGELTQELCHWLGESSPAPERGCLL